MVYAWEVKTEPSRNAEFALSITEYAEMIPPNSKSRRVLLANDNDGLSPTRGTNGFPQKNKETNESSYFDAEQP
jgi:hypothetical protein